MSKFKHLLPYSPSQQVREMDEQFDPLEEDAPSPTNSLEDLFSGKLTFIQTSTFIQTDIQKNALQNVQKVTDGIQEIQVTVLQMISCSVVGWDGWKESGMNEVMQEPGITQHTIKMFWNVNVHLLSSLPSQAMMQMKNLSPVLLMAHLLLLQCMVVLLCIPLNCSQHLSPCHQQDSKEVLQGLHCKVSTA